MAKPLRKKDALKDKDIELVRRAEVCLTLADKTSTSEALGAAVRELGRRPAAGAAVALLDYLPFIEDETVLDEVGSALARTGVHDHAPEPALAAALVDKNAVRRAVAAEAVGRAAGDNDGLRRAARTLLKDADVQVRRRAAIGLLASKDREAVPVLIALLAEVPAKETWRIEEPLFDLAGDKPPVFNAPHADDEGRKKYRDAWAGLVERERRQRPTSPSWERRPKPYLGYTVVTYTDYGKVPRRSARCSSWTARARCAGSWRASILPDGRSGTAQWQRPRHRAERPTHHRTDAQE